MSLPLFRRLRRCRALFALALCAWMAMGSIVWAKPDCCTSMDMHGMAAMHAVHHCDHHGRQTQGHATNHGGGACTCVHAAVDHLTSTVQAAGQPLLDPFYARTLPQNAPQPVFAPPLRPPVG